MKRLPVALTIVVAIALSILVALGVWQLQRLAWKQGLIARIEALKAAPAVPVETAIARGAEYANVTLDCPGLATAPYVELFALKEGQPGVRLISACPLATGGSVLIDRGFVAETISARPPETGPAAPVTIRGVLRRPDAKTFVTTEHRPGDRLWMHRDVPGIAAQLRAPNPAPLFVAARTSSNPQWLALRPTPLPEAVSNNHLAYALTWFGLAAALVGVYFAMLFSKARAR